MKRTRSMLVRTAMLAACCGATLAQDGGGTGSEREIGPGSGAENAALENEITPELTAAVTQGLAALAQRQNDDGSFGSRRYGKNVGITALCALAFLADGHMPGRGEYGTVVERSLEFMLNATNETGFVAADTSHGPMYGHGFAVLFLGEIYGMTAGGDGTQLAERTHDALVRSVRLIVQTQNEEGGWRYNPVPYDADISVTICQIMALRSARNAGIEVPIETIDRAVEYVRGCQNVDGGFKYQLSRGPSAWPRSAAGVASLFYAGVYEDDAIERGLDYLERVAMPNANNPDGPYFYYGQYYATQCMYLAGGERWATWWPAVREDILARQTEVGTWTDSAPGETYATAMALIILQMPKRYLPIFQK